MTDILLIQPPIEDFYFTHKRSIPYGLMSIAASLKHHGFSVEILDCLAVKKTKVMAVPDEMRHLLTYYGDVDQSAFSLFHDFRHYGYSVEYAGAWARERSPFLVGISSLFTPYGGMAEAVAKSVKKFLPECPIVMGGHHPTALPEAAMACSAVDFLIRGEGELAMPMLAHCVREEMFLKPNRKSNLKSNLETNRTSYPIEAITKAFERIPGIVFRKEGKFHISEPAWIDDFNGFPLPDFSLMNHRYYSRKGRGSAVVVAGRGCPMPCTYCSVGASSQHGKFRQRSVDHIMDELRLQVEKYNAGFIDFEDENLTLNRKWFMKLMEKIIVLKINFKKENLKIKDPAKEGVENSEDKNQAPFELRAMNGLYPPSLDLEMVQAMKAAGFKTLNLSLGTTSAAQLKKFRRPDVRAAYEKVLSMAEACQLDTVSYIIAGAPGQSPFESLDDLIYLTARKTLVGLSIFYPAPGSVNYEGCRQKGILPAHFSQMRSSALPIDDTTSRLEAVTLMRLARIINFMKAMIDETGELPEAVPCPQGGKKEIMNLAPCGRTFHNRLISYQKNGNSDAIKIDTACVLGMGEKQNMSVKLLQCFFYDGKIRGIDKTGQIFEHFVSSELTRGFLSRFKGIDVQGSR